MALRTVFVFLVVFLQSSLVLAREVKPLFSVSGPQENSTFCASKDYPVSWKFAKDPCYRVGSFTHFNELLPTSKVKTMKPVWKLS